MLNKILCGQDYRPLFHLELSLASGRAEDPCVCKAGSWLSGSTDLRLSEQAMSMQGLIRLTDGDNDCPRKKESRSKDSKERGEIGIGTGRQSSQVNIGCKSIKGTSMN